MTEVVSKIGGFWIVREQAAFGVGFNVYRPIAEQGAHVTLRKVNDPLSWFATQEAAEAWAQEAAGNG